LSKYISKFLSILLALFSRDLRGKAITDQGNQIKKVSANSFKVESQSGH